MDRVKGILRFLVTVNSFHKVSDAVNSISIEKKAEKLLDAVRPSSRSYFSLSRIYRIYCMSLI